MIEPRRPLRVVRLFVAGLLVAATAVGWLAPSTARADLQVDITRGHVEPLPIAVPVFYGETEEEKEVGRNLAAVISRNLEYSGLFRPVSPKAFIEKVSPSMLGQPRFADWRIINAQALVTGRVTLGPGQKFSVEFRLWDVFAGDYLAGLRFQSVEGLWRRIAHKASDAIYERLTGESGYFDTRIVYVSESGPLDNRVKRLAIMDQDGENLRFLTDGKSLALTPRFSPTAQEITYLSFERGAPRVYLRNLDTGQKEVLGRFPGMTFAPRFSPDGNRVVLTYAKDGNSELFEMHLPTGDISQLTRNDAIDTGPSYSPDGEFVAFESDRGGSQQIYVMESDGGSARRITFGKGRYGTPVWSPRGDLIAFTRQSGGRFAIGVIRPDGSGERILVQDYLVEGPTWAPNGRVLMFMRQTSRDPDASELVTIDITGHNERIVFTTTAASDPAWSPLIP
ncbi:MAG: Tol-Pal system protein TolB [Alphaproteobacteria bacterium]|jgi:TolB protein|nr:Tol-Pal system protein TolB [Alphaproteobacteria bacterium]